MKKELSSRFVNIDNEILISKAINAGYTVSKQFKGGFTLRDDSYQFDGLIPTIKIYNENNGISSLKLKLGVFRLICANGLMTCSDETIKRVIHIGKKPVDFINDFIKELVALRDQYKDLQSSVKNMNVIMSDSAQRLFVHSMIKARGLKIKDNAQLEETIVQLLECRRDEDAENTVFNIINRVQENLLRRSTNKDFRKLRLLKSEEKLDKLNQSLWDNALQVVA